MLIASDLAVTPSTTQGELHDLRVGLGIVGLTLVQQTSRVWIATATSVPSGARVTSDDLIAVGVGMDQIAALDRCLRNYADRLAERRARAS